jgi:pimeloyl-ACP methyl ester carboxylesterase
MSNFLKQQRARGIQTTATLISLFFCYRGLSGVTFSVTPSVVGSQDAGTITLSITGLTNGETVVVQKFLDANTNGVIDSGDTLWQQFQLQDGQASIIGGVTNVNVPGDTDSTGAQITAALHFPSSDFSQNMIGEYAFRLSSPNGHFTPVTRFFVITNVPSLQTITGSVVNSGTNVPNAVVIIFAGPRPGQNSPGNPLGGVVANSAGNYAFPAPVGTYMLLPFKSNYLASISTVVVSNGANTIANLTLTNATQSIVGKVADAASNSIGLPALFLHGSANGFFATAFSDPNGNFTMRVTPGQWGLGAEGLEAQGYLGFASANFAIDTTSGSSNGVIIPYPKATALFYGSVKDGQNRPLAGVDISSHDITAQHHQNVITDANGTYVAGALGGPAWSVEIDGGNNAAFSNYLFSQGLNNTNLSPGQAALRNFIALLATNQIAGNVQANGTNIAGVSVQADAVIDTASYRAAANTDSYGHYALNVAGSSWSLSLNCSGPDHSLDGILGSGNYQCPNQQSADLSNSNALVNFYVLTCDNVQITTPNLPDGEVDLYYDVFLAAAGCSSSFIWSLNSGSLPPGFQFTSGGHIYGTPTNSGTFYCSVRATDSGNHIADKALSLVIAPSRRPANSSPTVLSNRQFQLTLNGNPGASYAIQASTNLLNWRTVHYTNSPSSLFDFIDADAPAFSRRFYRTLILSDIPPEVIESASQTISASGGTIILPNRSSATILPGFFTADSLVTLSLLSSLPNQPASGSLASVGPVLSLSFATTNTSTTPQDIGFVLNFSNSNGAAFEGSAPLGQIMLPQVDDVPAEGIFLGLPGDADLPSGTATITFPADKFHTFVSSVHHSNSPRGLFSPSTVAGMVILNIALAKVPICPKPSLPQWLYWNGSGFTGNAPGLDPTKKTILFVHGIFSDVQHAFGGRVNEIMAAGCYEQALGFNYDWPASMLDGGAQLAAFLNYLYRQRGLTNVDIEAHSFGVPVSLYAAAVTTMPVRQMILLGGPINGTPLTAKKENIATLLSLLSVECINGRSLKQLENSPFIIDATPGSAALTKIRNLFPSDSIKVIQVAGNKPVYSRAPDYLADMVAKSVFGLAPNDGVIPVSSALALPTSVTNQQFHLGHTQLETDPGVIQFTSQSLHGNAAQNLLGIWSGTWAGTSSFQSNSMPISGTWSVDLRQVAYHDEVADAAWGTFQFAGNSYYWEGDGFGAPHEITFSEQGELSGEPCLYHVPGGCQMRRLMFCHILSSVVSVNAGFCCLSITMNAPTGTVTGDESTLWTEFWAIPDNTHSQSDAILTGSHQGP